MTSYNTPKYYSLLEMKNTWSKFVESCIKNGYDDYLVEYDNDISIRSKIEELIINLNSKSFPELELIKHQINEIDNKFKEMLLPNIERGDKFNWWERGILKNGKSDYSADIKLVYGIDIS